jgi:L-alanine-DL-glutamate epimerase-like enolase superfamily enzyme
MKITGLRIGRIRVPLTTPFKTAARTVNEIDDLVVILETDGPLFGIGATPSTPHITGCDHKKTTQMIEDFVFPSIKGCDISEIRENTKRVQASTEKANNAKSAIEIALYDLWSKQLNLPLSKALGGSIDEIQTGITISANPVFEMIADIEKAIAKGYRLMKIKCGTEPGADQTRLTKIFHFVATLRQKTELMIDANQGWTTEQTLYIMKQLESAGMVFKALEQPVKHNDLSGLQAIKEAITTPLMVDETCFNLKQATYILDKGIANQINVKLVKSAGISEAIKIGQLGAQRLIPCMMGCMLEGAIGVAAAAHVAAAFPIQFKYVDLDGPTLGQYNPIDQGTVFERAKVFLNKTPGLGISQIPSLSPNEF